MMLSPLELRELEVLIAQVPLRSDGERRLRLLVAKLEDVERPRAQDA